MYTVYDIRSDGVLQNILELVSVIKLLQSIESADTMVIIDGLTHSNFSLGDQLYGFIQHKTNVRFRTLSSMAVRFKFGNMTPAHREITNTWDLELFQKCCKTNVFTDDMKAKFGE